jgi:hypothetical protein
MMASGTRGEDLLFATSTGSPVFQRHKADDPTQSSPGRDALNSYPAKVRATMRAALVAVASARRSASLAGATGRR